MFDFQKLISTQYLFAIDRVSLQRSDWIFLILGGTLIALGILFAIWAKVNKVSVTKILLARYAKCFFVIGLLEVVWFGARYEYINFLGSHFMALLIGLVGLVWLGFIVWSNFTGYRKNKQQWDKEQLKLKYLQ